MNDPERLGVREFQRQIEAIYYAKDSARGALGTYAWLVEEIGELSRALRRGEPENLAEEFADCFAWLASLASLSGIDLATAAQKYAAGCPRCATTPCVCSHRE
ncbi:MAG: nucleotide pyrophosphohydrolase [Planctomycetota bacterium]|nr:MAG: nucleotide pyrophosphohydrolase [Planctomycetota bacterium]